MTSTGAILIGLGVSAFYIDVAAHFRFDFIEQHYEAFGMSILATQRFERFFLQF